MSVRRAPAAQAAQAAQAPQISHAERLRFSRLSLPAEPTGVSTRAQSKRQLLLDNLPPKEVLLQGYDAVKWLMVYSRKMSETDGKYVHYGEWSGVGNVNYFSAFNYLRSNEPFLRDMLRAYGGHLFASLDGETEEKRMLNAAFLRAMVAIAAVDKFSEAVPDYLEDRSIFGEYADWPSSA